MITARFIKCVGKPYYIKQVRKWYWPFWKTEIVKQKVILYKTTKL